MSPFTRQNLPSIVAEAVDAANAHDTDAFLACFAADGVVNDWGSQYRGVDEIRVWSDREFIGVDVQLSDLVASIDASGRIAVRTQVGGRGYNGPGTFTFTVHDDRITLMHITA
jgi:hypothetical protein